MQKWPPALFPFAKSRFIPLHYRVVLVTSGMLILLLGVLTLTLVWFQGHTIRQQLEERGQAIGQSLAAISTNALLNYDYITLEQFANRAALDPNILYVIVHDKENRVAGYSNRPDLQGRTLGDNISIQAVETAVSLVQHIEAKAEKIPGLEVATPVLLPNSGDRWGTVRVCLSLAPLLTQLRQTILIIIVIGLIALGAGIILSILGARRVTRPLGNLVRITMDVAQGNFHQNIEVKTGDEVEVLAANFSVMIRKIVAHQKRQEQQLYEIQRLQDYTEKLMTTMADGLLSVDMSGKIATVNPAARNLLEIAPAASVQGESIGTILGESTELFACISKILEKPEPIGQKELEIKKGAEHQTFLIGSSILYDTEKNPHEVIINLHDITELKRLEARIRQSERLAALGTLAAGMAHEIRNPLSAIKTFVQLLPRKIDKPGFLEKFNRTVPRETDRINLLVEELLELSRMPKYNFAATDIKVLLQQAIDLVQADLQQRQIECSLIIEDPLPRVLADANQLVKAFHNLVRNAVQAMATGGRLIIESFLDENHQGSEQDNINARRRLSIIFQDSGQGIPPEVLKQIFNPFFTTKDSGTGLGLPITHKVITEHGGQIEAESKEGQGTRFIISLPLQDNPASQAPSLLASQADAEEAERTLQQENQTILS